MNGIFANFRVQANYFTSLEIKCDGCLSTRFSSFSRLNSFFYSSFMETSRSEESCAMFQLKRSEKNGSGVEARRQSVNKRRQNNLLLPEF